MNTEDLSTTFINKIPQTVAVYNFILKSQWRSNEVKLQILDNHQSKAWEGIISLDELKQSAEELEIPYEKFYAECKEALTHNGGAQHFEYSIDNDKFTLSKNDEFHIQYLEVNMKQDYELKQSLTVHCVDLIASLRKELSSVQKECKELEENYQTVLKTLERCLAEKNYIETKLLRRFSVILNSKKDKIAELQDLLVEKNKLKETGLSGVEPNKSKSTEAPGSSGANADFMIATQVMTQPVFTLPKRKKFNAAENVVSTRVAHKIATVVDGDSSDEGDVTIVDSPDIFEELL